MMADDSDEFTIPELPPRSQLYHLEPVGVGTPEVESLTGYIARLAEAHCVTVYILSKHMICPRQGKEYIFFNHGGVLKRLAFLLNGAGVGAERVVCALESLTMRTDLRPLTLLPWSTSLSPFSLFRRERVWCPICYEDWRTTGRLIYEPLIWTLKPVEVCARHRISFHSVCPHCERPQHWLANRSRPGHCSKCRGWLGAKSADSSYSIDDAAAWKYRAWVAESVGLMLASGAHLASTPTKETVTGSLMRCVESGAVGDVKALAKQAGVETYQASGWLRGFRPQLSAILKICYRVNLEVADFLTGSFFQNDLVHAKNKPAENGSAVDGSRTISLTPFWRAIGEHVDDLLRSNETPPPIKEIARDRGVNEITLRVYFPDKCRAVTLRRREDRFRSEEGLLKAALKRRPPQPLKEVCGDMGIRRPGRLRKNYPELCKAIVERFDTYDRGQLLRRRRARVAEIRKVAVMLHGEGQYPSIERVAAGLSVPNISLQEDMRNVLRAVRRELGYSE